MAHKFLTYFFTLTFAIAAPIIDNEDDHTFLTAEDFTRARQLNSSDLISGNKKAPWIQKAKFRGDYQGRATQGTENRNGVRLDTDKWPAGIIPYVVSRQYSTRERAILARAIQAYHDRTCIKWVPKSANHRDYVYVGKIDGCYSDVGRASGRQEVSLDDGCVEYDTAIHELMHAVGFWHEHERWDRDDHIQIVWDNIESDAYDQFGKVDLLQSQYYGEPYDYFSIMHYDSKSFTRNGKDTIEAKQPEYTWVIGRVKDFSQTDLNKINKMYNCPQVNVQQQQQQQFVPNGNPQFPSVDLSPRRPDRPPSSAVFQPGIIQQPFEQQPPLVPAFPAAGLPSCSDKATLCWRWTDRCQTPHFVKVMQEFCAATCGFC